MDNHKRFIVGTVVLVFTLTILCISIFKIFFWTKFLFIFALLPLLFGVANILIYRFMISGAEPSVAKFSRRYMLSTTIKLLGSLAFIVVFLLIKRNYALPFLATFLFVYLVFLVHEILGILNFFKKNSKSETTHTKI